MCAMIARTAMCSFAITLGSISSYTLVPWLASVASMSIFVQSATCSCVATGLLCLLNLLAYPAHCGGNFFPDRLVAKKSCIMIKQHARYAGMFDIWLWRVFWRKSVPA
ncbi:uncharacterized protein F5Z01DRAFT_642822 [Emericellopsis atlantica]|uniref:Uncharacterized protein n=1 Tax=Emericellopsis atlantica TaxID=2614577 RepID=A0A9P7ZY49_9HYPO|nr:uncharacterized protein F5Z01DRAFT_642822 [Emericellopsis atlantica]KAG9259307.1 hypothetical protein F5Z01DRAFT_642822 [Emericellopsis atlantica]